ncbi:GNAT family N-acetyltransferase [Synechococcus sp. AH-229-G18]|nr:GNAT family N-acetyltransferase [Synechococcus sp. AH-229-G18]
MLLNPDPKTIRLQRTHALACLKLDALALNGLWTSDHWERELSDPQRICIGIAASADTLLAMACGWVVLDELQITVLGVEPEHRRRGLGRAVLKRLLLDASSAGARHAILDVAEDNHGARTLYSAFGFQTVGRRDRYYRDGKNALIQSLEMQREMKLNSINSALNW